MRVAATVEDGGRLRLADAACEALGLSVGDQVVLVVNDGEDVIELVLPEDPVQRAQAIVRRYVSADRRLADEVIAERRDEVRGG